MANRNHPDNESAANMFEALTTELSRLVFSNPDRFAAAFFSEEFQQKVEPQFQALLFLLLKSKLDAVTTHSNRRRGGIESTGESVEGLRFEKRDKN